MRVAMSLVVLFTVLLLGVSISQNSYGIGNYNFELEWGQSGKTSPGYFLFPQRIAEDVNGNLYVTDLGNSRIQIFDNMGNFINAWGIYGSDAGEFNSPQGIVIYENFVFVSDNILNKIPYIDITKTYSIPRNIFVLIKAKISNPFEIFLEKI